MVESLTISRFKPLQPLLLRKAEMVEIVINQQKQAFLCFQHLEDQLS